MVNIEDLKFDEKGLIPAVVVDAESKNVLTVAYMNRESLQISINEGRTCFWSRSRQELWRKGETSGNVQHIVTIYEIADLAYHVMVLMVQAGISLEDVKKELAGRHVIDHKVKQEKMTK